MNNNYIADIQTIIETTPNNLISYQVGNCRSGEIYNEATIVLRMPGLKSTPLPTGTVNGYNSFTPGQTSRYAAQVYNVETNGHWITIGMRDNRTEVNLPSDPVGSTRLFAEADTNSSIYLDISGNILATSDQNFTITATNGTLQLNSNNSSISATANSSITLTSNGNNFSVVSSTINLGSTSPALTAAISQKTDANFTTIQTAAQAAVSALGAAPTPPTVAAALVAFVTALAAPYPSSASSTVKITS